MEQYQYTECGLDDLFLVGVPVVRDDHGERVVSIPNIRGLHKAIAKSILESSGGMSGKELRFLRAEMGLTQAELGQILQKEALTIGRWEREEADMGSVQEALLRRLVAEILKISLDISVEETVRLCEPSARRKPIVINGKNPDNYISEAA